MNTRREAKWGKISWFLFSSPSRLLLFGIYYRVFLCTLLTIRNKYIYFEVAGDLPLMRAVASQCPVWKTHHRFCLFMKLCSRILQKYAFLSFALYWSALPEPFSSLIKDAESFTLFCLWFQGLILYCLFGDLLPWENLLLYEWKCFSEAVNQFKINKKT